MQPLAPHTPRPSEKPMYFVLADHGSAGTAWAERDPNDMDRETTILDLIGAQIEAPLRVIEVDIADGLSRDVSEEIAQAIAERVAGQKVRHDLLNFLHDHAGIRYANALKVA